MELSKEQIDAILSEALPDVTRALKEQLVRKVEWQIEEEAVRLVHERVKEWVVVEVIPEVERSLVESREGLVSIGTEIAPKIVAELGKAFVASISSNLEQSYSRRKIFSSLLE